MTGLTRGGGAPWLVAAVLAAGAVAAPNLQAQEGEPSVDSTEVRERPLSVSLGLRLEFLGLASPGASLQMTLNPGRLWFSLEYLAQMMRWKTNRSPCDGRHDLHTRRDHVHIGRLVAGVGRGGGPSAFVFYERGAGATKTCRGSLRQHTYGLRGVGLGAGYTAGRVTAALDFSLGEELKTPSPYLYGLFGISVRIGLF